MNWRLVEKLVLKDLIGPFINGLLMFLLLVFTAGYLFQATELLVQGIPFWTVLQFVIYSLPSVMTQTFPMAMLLAALLGFGRLSSDSEAVALFGAGISFPRMTRAVICMGGVVSLIAFAWNDTVVPPCSARSGDIRQQALQHLARSDRPLSYPVESENGRSIEEFVTVNGGFDAKTLVLRGVCIIKYSQHPGRVGQPEVVIYCDRAVAADLKGRNWVYHDGFFVPFTPSADTGNLDDQVTVHFNKLRLLPRNASIGKSFAEVLNTQNNDPNRKSFRALREEIKEDREKGRDIMAQGKEVDLYGKIALPLASLIFGIVGAALGMNTRRGGGRTVGFGMAIFIVFLYWIFYHSMFVIGKNGGLAPMWASFLPDIVGCMVGLLLALRASR